VANQHDDEDRGIESGRNDWVSWQNHVLISIRMLRTKTDEIEREVWLLKGLVAALGTAIVAGLIGILIKELSK